MRLLRSICISIPLLAGVLIGVSEAQTWSAIASGTTQSLLNITVADSLPPAGPYWTPTTTGTSKRLRSIVFLDDSTGWAVGDSGKILKTADAGANWSTQPSGTIENLYSVRFLNSNLGWVVGDGKRLLKTTNGGTSWNNTGTITGASRFNSVAISDSQTVWAASTNGLYRTTDGGASWVLAFSSLDADPEFLSVQFKGVCGWGLQASQIYRTTNGGATWARRAFVVGGHTGMAFTDSLLGWSSAASGKYEHSEDGAKIYTAVENTVTGTGTTFRTVGFLNDQLGWLAGDSATLLHTTNGGTSWAKESIWPPVSNLTSRTLWELQISGAANGWIAGDDGLILKYVTSKPEFSYIGTERSYTTGAQIAPWIPLALAKTTSWSITPSLTTRTGLQFDVATGAISGTPSLTSPVTSYTVTAVNGKGSVQKSIAIAVTSSPWIRLYQENSGFPSDRTISALQFFPSNIGYAAINAPGDGFKGVFKTTDAGASWQRNYLTGVSSYRADAIHFYDEMSGFMGRTYGSVVGTTNGGTTWVVRLTAATGFAAALNSVFSTSATTRYVVGAGGLIAKSTDVGATWSVLPGSTSKNLNGVYFTDSENGYAVGDSGTIRKTTNGGTDWAVQSSGSTRALRAVRFVNATWGFAVGDSGTILLTTNGGSQWMGISSGTTVTLRAVHFPDALDGFIAGDSGVILASENGGGIWTRQPTTTRATLRTVWMLDDTSGYAAGDSGVILQYTRIYNPPVSLRPETSVHASLVNRTFTYTLASPTAVRICLLDLRGREVWRTNATQQSAGSHAITLPMKNLETSLYLLEFRAGAERRIMRVMAQ